MAHRTVVLAGDFPVEHLALERLIGEFGWSFKEANSLRALAELNVRYNLVAVLFSPRNLDLRWDQALGSIINAAPRALPILCHRFGDAIDWPRVAEAGAFHSLLLPFNMREVRQSLGFVWAATCRSAIVPIRQPVHLPMAIGNEAPLSRAQAAS